MSDMHVLTVTAIVATSKWLRAPWNRVTSEPYPETAYCRWARDHA